MKTALLGPGTIPLPIDASGIGVSDPGGFFGGPPLTVQDVIDLIAAGGLGSYLTTTLGGQGVVQALGNLTGSATVDLANANKFWGTLTGSTTLTTVGWTNLKDAQISVELIQDGTGGWTPTFSGVTWIGGTPTWDTTAGTVTHVVLFSRDGGTTIYGAVVGGGGGGTGFCFSPAAYGALSTYGSPVDDTVALQDCIDAAAVNGGVVCLGPWTYYIAFSTSGARHCLTVPSNVSIVGDGMFSSILEVDPGETLPAGTVFIPLEIGTATTGANNVTLRDFGVICNFSVISHVSKYIEGIAARHDSTTSAHSDDVTLQRVRVVDGNTMIYCCKDGTSGSARTGTQFERWSIRECLVDTSDNKAFELQEAVDSEIVDCIGVNCADGAQVNNYTRRSRIAGNRIEYKDGGVNVTEGVNDIEVSGNILTAIAGGGVGFNGGIVIRRESFALTGPTSARVVIRDNIVNDTVSADQIGLRFATYTANTGVAVFEDYLITGNVFNVGGETYLYDEQFAAKSSATGLRIFDNIFMGDVLTSASWASDRTRMERNTLKTAFTALTNNWDFRGNIFLSTFTLTATGCTLDDGYVRNVLVSATPPTSGYILTATSATAASWQTSAAASAAAISAMGFVGQILMTDGVTSPPEPLQTEDGSDWLYADIP